MKNRKDGGRKGRHDGKKNSSSYSSNKKTNTDDSESFKSEEQGKGRHFARQGSRGSGAQKDGFRSSSNKDSKYFRDKDNKTGKANPKSKILPSDQEKFQKRPRRNKFDESDLSFGKKPIIREEQNKQEEVTFSKSLDKWETPPPRPPYKRLDDRFERKKKQQMGKFRRQFDNENPREKVFSAGPSGQPREGQHYTPERTVDGEMPLNKYIAHCGVCSRRDAVLLIKEGKVKVNGELIVEPGFKVTVTDQVTISGKKITIQKNLIYVLLNKPKGYITTNDDPKERRTVLDIFKGEITERIFPVGRLDRNTTGLLLLTNDGALSHKLAHPKYEVKKVYQVTLDKNLSVDDFRKIQEGVVLEDGPAPVDRIEFLEQRNELGLEIHSGKNRIVRRIFESLGYNVEKLDRVMYAGLTKKNVLRGKWRFLTKQEVINLKHLA